MAILSNFDESFENTFTENFLSQLNKSYAYYFLTDVSLTENKTRLVDSNEVRSDIEEGLKQNNIDTRTKSKLENDLKNIDKQT